MAATHHSPTVLYRGDRCLGVMAAGHADPADQDAVLEIAHEGVVDAFWDEYGAVPGGVAGAGAGAGGVGWDMILLGLGAHLESGEAVDPEVAMTFTLAPEDTEFVCATAAAWAEVAMADGDDPVAAKAAGERTFPFYTTAPRAGRRGIAARLQLLCVNAAAAGAESR